jgi:polyphosphate kinase 2 (PPK2 family)
MNSVQDFEKMLVQSGIKLFKYYLDISKDEQKRRLKDRKTNPLKQWKISPIDEQAIKYWKPYSAARDKMLVRTHSVLAPWTLVHADDKRQARIHIIKDMLGRLSYAGKDERLTRADTKTVFPYDTSNPQANQLAK